VHTLAVSVQGQSVHVGTGLYGAEGIVEEVGLIVGGFALNIVEVEAPEVATVSTHDAFVECRGVGCVAFTAGLGRIIGAAPGFCNFRSVVRVGTRYPVVGWEGVEACARRVAGFATFPFGVQSSFGHHRVGQSRVGRSNIEVIDEQSVSSQSWVLDVVDHVGHGQQQACLVLVAAFAGSGRIKRHGEQSPDFAAGSRVHRTDDLPQERRRNIVDDLAGRSAHETAQFRSSRDDQTGNGSAGLCQSGEERSQHGAGHVDQVAGDADVGLGDAAHVEGKQNRLDLIVDQVEQDTGINLVEHAAQCTGQQCVEADAIGGSTGACAAQAGAQKCAGELADQPWLGCAASGSSRARAGCSSGFAAQKAAQQTR